LSESWGRAAEKSGKRSPLRILWDLSQEFGRSRNVGVWTFVLGIGALWIALPPGGLPDFPRERFPDAVVARNQSVLTPATGLPRVLTSDQWADYLIFHFYPRQKVFFDGRSDFYGPGVGSDYQELLSAGRDWRIVLDRYRFDLALLPTDWPLGSLLAMDPGWRVLDRDSSTVLLAHEDNPLKSNGITADVHCVSEVHEAVRR
jgi:hypothetical protein